ncbi:MAG: hypothetical protein IKF68_01725, partial [Erysipelotrichaceae bacterium]|nr:hypothetical protein [Erysipelotrichaceae bacterium]
VGHVQMYYPARSIRNRGLRKAAIAVLFIVLLMMFVTVSSSSVYFTAAMGASALLAALFAGLISGDDEKPVRSERIIRCFADITYEFYLVHYPVVFFLENTEIPLFLKIPLILLISLFLSFLLKCALSFRKGRRMLSVVLCALMIVCSIFGAISIIRSEDHSEEVKELEERLEENRKLIEERNRAYASEVEAEEEAWERLLESGISDEEAVKELLAELPVVGVGDSIMLDAVRPLYEVFPNGYFNCEISRSLYYGEKILSSLKEEGKLSEPIVLSLGTNGDYSQKRCEELIEIVEDREVFWINSVGADDPTYNGKFAAFAQDHPSIHIIHWEEVSKGHPEYFYYDGIHVIGEGVRAYTEAIYDAVFERYLEIYRTRKEEAKTEKENASMERIAFFGNDALTSSYEYIGELSQKAVFHIDTDYSFSTLYSQIEGLLEEGDLEGRVIFVFDRKASLSERDYERLAELLHDREVTVFAIQDTVDIRKDNVRIIDFSNELKNDPALLSSDRRHLSEKGSERLGRLIHDSIGNTDDHLSPQ